jgi:acetyltransferase-like isoleucine patch superfamily enzyme
MIGNNVWIGAGVQILPGVSIGDNSVIGAGSIVNKSIPANVLAVGNPCRVVREIDP